MIATGAQNVVTTAITIEVYNTVPNIAYTSSSYNFSLNTPATTGSLANTGGAITSCAIDHAVPAGLSFNPSTCIISGTPTAIAAIDTFVITASNAVGNGTPKSITIEVLDAVPNIAYAGSPYTFTLYDVASTSGVPANTGGGITACSVSPALPAGLSVSQVNCEISGTPSAPSAQANYTLTPSNGTGNGTARTVSIEVLNIIPNIAYSAATYNFNISAASTSGTPTNTGGAITSCTSDIALPAGLSLNATTCAISGTPTAVAAAANYTITPSNAVGSGTARVLSIEVVNTVPNITYGSATYLFNINAISTTGTPANTGGAITGCASDIALPTGLSLNATTCVISGTPTAVTAAANYTITPSNAVGNGTARVLSIEVLNIAPNIAYSAATYNFNISAVSTSGTPTNTGGAITACTSDIALPAGLSLSATTCEISGTPSAVTAATNYTITPSNAAGNGTARVLSIEVLNVVPNIAYGSGVYSFSLNSASTTNAPTNTGGAITACTSDITLPTGLSVNATTCEISGTPTVLTAAANYTITPSNAVGSGTARVLSIEVANSVPSIAYSSATYTFSRNDAASTSGTPVNSGGTITGCSVAPALPTGLSLSATDCTISGTPTAATAAANYVITPSGAGGSGAAQTLSITIADIVPSIAYSSSSYNFTQTFSASSGTPTSTGGAITSCTVSPALPAGLSISSTTCAVTGTPTTVTTAANYDITPANSTGSGTTRTLTIEVYTPITITLSQTDVVCRGANTGAVSATPTSGTGPYTYQWNNGSTASSISSLFAQTFNVTVTDSLGVKGYAATTLTQPASSLVLSATVTHVRCYGASTGSVTSVPSGGTGVYTYSWDNGPTTAANSGLVAGTYTVTVTDSGGCVKTKTTTITQPAAPLSNTFSFSGALPAETISTAAAGGTAPYTYLWQGGLETTSSKVATTNTLQTVKITDSKNCWTNFSTMPQ